MDSQAKENDAENMSTILKFTNFVRLLNKRKRLLGFLAGISLVLAVITIIFVPKVYMSEVVFVLKLTDLSATDSNANLNAKEIAGIMGAINQEKIEAILPKSHQSVDDLRIITLRDSTDKFMARIDLKDPSHLPEVVTELTAYLNDNLIIKRYIEQEKEKLTKRSEELLQVIEDSKSLMKTYNDLLKKGNLPVGFNPIELNKKISDLKVEKIMVAQMLKNVAGVEEIKQPFFMKKTIKPNKLLILVCAIVGSLVLGIMLSFLLEIVEKINNYNKSDRMS